MNYVNSTDFANALTSTGSQHITIRPHCPWQNGKVERFNRTLAIEWAYRQPYTSNATRTAALDPWLTTYNTQRGHHALSGLPPTDSALISAFRETAAGARVCASESQLVPHKPSTPTGVDRTQLYERPTRGMSGC